MLIHYYGLLACSLRHYALYPRFQTFCRGTLLSTLSTIYGFPSSPRCNLFSPQNLCKFCFNFSRVECWLQEKLKTKLLQKFVGKKKLYYGEIESRTDRFTAWAWSSWREWRSSWITVKLNAWVGYETFLGLANHNSFRVFSWHISSQFALVLAYYFTTLIIIKWICVDLIKLQTECVATVVMIIVFILQENGSEWHFESLLAE